MKPSIKNNEVSAAETVCAFHAVVFMLLPFPRTPSLFWTTGQSSSIDGRTASSTARCSWRTGSLRRSVFAWVKIPSLYRDIIAVP